MAAKPLPTRYTDAEYQAAHDNLFAHPLTPEIEKVIPPGVSHSDFDSAIAELTAVVGEDAVFTGERLKEYVDPYEIPETGVERKVPGAAVCPASVPEIQAVLATANKFSIPVWTFSRGKNLGYGGPAPIVRGSLALDLHRLDKVIEVNEQFAYAVVEPGVTFGDLYRHCADKGLKVWPSTASLGWGSVLGNTLDRGMGFVPTGVHHQHMCGLEVVLADGSVFRTGQFANSNSVTSHISPLSFGPSVEGLFLQSNLGIVTKMGIWLTPQPQAYMACTFDMPEPDDVATIVDVFGDLRRRGVIPHVAYCFSLVEWTSIFGKRADWYSGTGPIPEWRLREISKEIDTGFWTMKFGLYGAPGVVEAQYAEILRVTAERASTGRLRGEMFAGDGARGKTDPSKLLDAATVPQPYGGMFVGVPSMWSLPLVDYYNPKEGGDAAATNKAVGAHGAYSPIVPLDGKSVLDWVNAAREVFEREGQDLLCDFFMHDRSAVFVCMLCFDKTNPEQRAATERIYDGLFEEGTKRGFAGYRSHITHMDKNAELYDFNDHAYRKFVERIKDALDPNGILSPGKMGIWPKRFQESKTEHIGTD